MYTQKNKGVSRKQSQALKKVTEPVMSEGIRAKLPLPGLLSVPDAQACGRIITLLDQVLFSPFCLGEF